MKPLPYHNFPISQVWQKSSTTSINVSTPKIEDASFLHRSLVASGISRGRFGFECTDIWWSWVGVKGKMRPGTCDTEMPLIFLLSRFYTHAYWSNSSSYLVLDTFVIVGEDFCTDSWARKIMIWSHFILLLRTVHPVYEAHDYKAIPIIWHAKPM